MQLPPTGPGESDFWDWKFDEERGIRVELNTDAVIQNAIANMRRLEEEGTIRAVVDFLRDKGYVVIEPEGDEC